MVLALSTSWNAFRHASGEELVFELQGLGFNTLELSFNLTGVMVDEIERLVKRQAVSVCSLHNFCPIPEGVPREQALPDYFSLASEDEEQRLRAVQQTRNTIDTAARLDARAVVLHCGRVEISDHTRELIELYDAGRQDAPEFAALRSSMIKERVEVRQRFLDACLRSIDELNRYARAKDVLLGVETRFYYREIPCLEEVGVILDSFRDSQVYYWHDTGHAQLMENLGLVPGHEEFLRRYCGRLLGVHLHDIRGCSDHQPPGAGDLDFRRIAPYIPAGAIRVMEVHHPATAEQLLRARENLRLLFDGTD